MTYFYRGKRHAHKPIKRALKKVAARVWDKMHGRHPPGGGGRDVEHYVEQAMRQVQDKLSEPTEPTQPDNSSEKD
jgi:hypothetical protein